MLSDRPEMRKRSIRWLKKRNKPKQLQQQLTPDQSESNVVAMASEGDTNAGGNGKTNMSVYIISCSLLLNLNVFENRNSTLNYEIC